MIRHLLACRSGAMLERLSGQEPERAEFHSRSWEIRRRVKGKREWHVFAVLDPDTWWLEVEAAVEYFRSTSRGEPGVEYAAFEIRTRRVEVRREW